MKVGIKVFEVNSSYGIGNVRKKRFFANNRVLSIDLRQKSATI